MTHTDHGSVEAGRLDEQLCFALYAATNAVTRSYRSKLDALGLTYPQYLVLLVLWEDRSCTIGRLAQRLQLASHAVSPIVDRLETAGHVTRRPAPDDGRVVLVELTDAGAALEIDAIGVQEHARCATTLDDAEVVRLRATLVDLVERMGA